MTSACQYEYGFGDGPQSQVAYSWTTPDNFPPQYLLTGQRTADLTECAADNIDSFNESSYNYVVNEDYATGFNGYYAAETQVNPNCNCPQTKNRHATPYRSLNGENLGRCATRSYQKQGNVNCNYIGQSEYTVCDLSTPVDSECPNVYDHNDQSAFQCELTTTTYNLRPSPAFYPDSNISYITCHDKYNNFQPALDPPQTEFTHGVLASPPTATQCVSSAYSYRPDHDVSYPVRPQPEWTNEFYQPPLDYDSRSADSRFLPDSGQSNTPLVSVSKVPVTCTYDAYFVTAHTAGGTHSSLPNYQIGPASATETYQSTADDTNQPTYPSEFTSYTGSRIHHSNGSCREYCPYTVQFGSGIPVTCEPTMLATDVQSYPYSCPNATVDAVNNFGAPQNPASSSRSRQQNQEDLDLRHSFKPAHSSCEPAEPNKPCHLEPSTDQENFNEAPVNMPFEPPSACCAPDHSARFSCSQCHKNFSRYSHLEAHLRVHTGERPFCCCICEKTFSQVANLSRHLKSHKVWPRLRNVAKVPNSPGSVENVLVKPSSSINEVAKRVQIKRVSSSPLALGSSTGSSLPKSFYLIDSQYECGFCWKRFDSFIAIKSHLVRHNDEKVFQCLVASCGETFKEVGDFLEHLSIHRLSDPNWLHCKQCNKQYNTIAELFEHYAGKGEMQKTACRPPPAGDDSPTDLCSQAPANMGPYESPKSSRRLVLLPLSRLSSRRYSKTSRFRCPVCKFRRFARVGLLRAHLLSDHLNSRNANVCTKLSRPATLPEDGESVCVPHEDPPPTPGSPTVAEDPSSVENEAATLTPTLQSHDVERSATQIEFLVGGYRQKSVVSVTSNAASGSRRRSFQCVICSRTFKKRKFFEDHEQLCRQKQVERERRQRWRDNRKSANRDNLDWEAPKRALAPFSPDNTVASGPQPSGVVDPSPSSSSVHPPTSLPDVPRRSARSRTRK